MKENDTDMISEGLIERALRAPELWEVSRIVPFPIFYFKNRGQEDFELAASYVSKPVEMAFAFQELIEGRGVVETFGLENFVRRATKDLGVKTIDLTKPEEAWTPERYAFMLVIPPALEMGVGSHYISYAVDKNLTLSQMCATPLCLKIGEQKGGLNGSLIKTRFNYKTGALNKGGCLNATHMLYAYNQPPTMVDHTYTHTQAERLKQHSELPYLPKKLVKCGKGALLLPSFDKFTQTIESQTPR